MRYLLRATLAIALGLALVSPGAAWAAVSSFRVTRQAELGAEGRTAALGVTINCTPGFPDEIVLSLSQSHGGFGVAGAEVACNGTDRSLNIVIPAFDETTTFRHGKAVVSGCYNSGFSDAADLGPTQIKLGRRLKPDKLVDALAGTNFCVE